MNLTSPSQVKAWCIENGFHPNRTLGQNFLIDRNALDDILDAAGQKIGICDLRIGHNEKTYIGGNIGYGVKEPYRGRHYAAKACALLFRQAKKHGMDRLFITCVPENAASARTCELAGGRYIETADIPAENEMYAEGKRRVRIYRFDLR